MAVTYGFYNAINHDRLYDAIQMSSIFDGIIRDGIFSTIGDTMIVTAPEDGMYVNVGSGRAWFNHTWTLNDTDYPIEAEQSEVVLDRIDAVILEVNSSAEVRANSIKFLKGTPSSNPVKPTLTHNAEVNQYALAYVRIRAGQTTIFQSDIENAVGTDETPFITGVLQQVSIETLLKQWEAEFNTYFTNFKNTSTTEFNNWFAAKVSEYTAWFAQMQTNMDSNFNEFDAWFQRIKGQLSEDAAGHLQVQIDNLNSDINALEAEMPFAGGSKVNINFEYDVVPNIQYSNEHYKLTVGDTVRENNFSSSKLHFNEYGILTVGDGVLEVTYDVTDSRTGKVTHASYTYTINMPYFGRFAYNVTISAYLYSYQGWLESIGKDASSYPTIGDVLADEKLLRELMTRHASVDYLVEWLANNNEDAHTVLNNDYCAKWINLRDYALDKLYANPTVKAVMDEVDKYGYGEWALIDGTWQPKGNVPIMTSNTAPYGKAFSSGSNSWESFNGNTTDETTISSTVSKVHVGYHFVNPICVKRFGFLQKMSNSTTEWDINLQWSDDNSSWNDAGNSFKYKGYGKTTLEMFNVNNNNEYHTYWRIYINKGASGTAIAQEVQFYGRELKVSVPKMTSDTAPWGEASASNYSSSVEPYKAFDSDDETLWISKSAGPIEWIQYKFNEKVIVKQAKIATNNNRVTKFNIQGSNDGTQWTTILVDTNLSTSSIVNITNNTGFQYYRLNCLKNSSNGKYNTGIATLQLYGLDYSEREFGEGSTMKYLYDHGVELEPIEVTQSSAMAEKQSDCIYLKKSGTSASASAKTTNIIDLTSYKLARIIAGLKNSKSGSDYGQFATYNGDTRLSYANIVDNLMPSGYMDISSVSQSANVGMYLNATNGSVTYEYSITEMWLE